jgi:Alkylmercury lyase
VTEFDRRVRWHVYDVTMREGTPPLAARLAELLNAPCEEIAASLERLAEARMLVLQRHSREILMAGPFSAVPTPFRVTFGAQQAAHDSQPASSPCAMPAPNSDLPATAYGNCIWDALGVIAALGKPDARVDTSCGDCGASAQLFVRNGELHASGFMHFLLPPKLWWQDVVFT